MVSNAQWQSTEGRALLNSIVTSKIPTWTTGLYPFQADCITRILDGEDLLCCTATGDRKSALFMVPIIVHVELWEQKEKYRDFATNAREKPVGIVVTPTKGLAGNLVCFQSFATEYIPDL